MNLAGKILPQDVALEEAILGQILENPKKIYDIIHIVKPDMFYKESNRYIFSAMLSVFDEHRTIDLILLTKELRKMKKLEEVGGSYFLSSLEGAGYKAMDINSYISYFAELWMRREHISISNKFLNKAFDESVDPFDTIEKNIKALERTIEFKKFSTSFSKQLESIISNVINNSKREEGQSYFQLHDNDIAQHLALQPNRVVLIPSNRGEGKTSFLSWIIDGMLTNNNDISVLWFTFEDPIHTVILKFISMRVNMTVKQLNGENYTLTPENEESVLEAKKDISGGNWNIEFVENICTTEEIRRKIKSHQEKYRKKAVVVIDNFGLISKKGIIGTDIEKDEEICKDIVAMKQESGACIIIPHHLTKDAGDPSNLSSGYRVTEKHVRGSGRILDYFPQCLAIVRPGNHPDVVDLYNKSEIKVDPTKLLPLTYDNFIQYIWNLNPEGSKVDAFHLIKDAYTEEIQKDNPEFTFNTICRQWTNTIK